MQPPLIIAHRTSPAYAPENSLEGIRVTFEQGADGVEIDLRMSLDLKPFLMHDNTMRRTTGWPLPIELTPAAIVRKQRLKSLALPELSSPSPRTQRELRGEEPPLSKAEGRRTPLSAGGEGAGGGVLHVPPTLAEAIDATPPDKLFAVDVKTPWAVFALVPEIKRRGMQSRTLAWCSSEQVVRYVVKRLPGVEVAYYKDFEDGPNNIEFIGKAARIGAHAVSLDWRAINADVVGAAHALGLKVYSWHKQHPVTPEKIEAGLDGLITDHPRVARDAIERFGL